MVEANFYLPNECWESIFAFLNHSDEDEHNHCCLKSLSLVSKHFLSITNAVQFSLNIYNPTRPFLYLLFKRFTNLTHLDFTCFRGDLDALLSQISCFRLNLTSLKISNQYAIPANGLRAFSRKITTLTSLTCSNLVSFDSTDLNLIAECFPLLEELDLSYPLNFINSYSYLLGVETLSTSLIKLRKINLTSHAYLNDQLLFQLFKNCKLLEEAVLLYCCQITNAGIASALRKRPSLRSLSLSNNKYAKHITLDFSDSLVSLRSLSCFDLLSLHISDELLSSIATIFLSLPLRRLVLQNCTGYSYYGIYCLLYNCRSIQHLDLQNATFMNDQCVAQLSLFLGDLRSVNLSKCSMLTHLALFVLARSCPSISEIKMEYTSIGKNIVENSNSSMDFVVNPRLKSLYLAHNSRLRSESLIMFASMFPNLQMLDLSYCYNISEESIYQVLKRCCKIRHLNLTGCNAVNYME
ncbi:hypothetical protein TSUD_258900 [Trifolium subterraneum]|uniref:Uncharacterized protein n=1 Tax=Trifolium subterraneum TaxID=3900 RepID=A0A2Z6NIF3_TRISU|nr:hypothetical protein TSUD_258900 [Trifolium subterraneum]